MKKSSTLVFTCLLMFNLFAQDRIFLSTNKNAYVVGEQVRFNISRFTDQMLITQKEYELAVDLVAPDGSIVQTKSLIKKPTGKYFFTLPDTLHTGIYRVIANTIDLPQAIKRIHVYDLAPGSPTTYPVAKITFKVHGGVLVSNKENRISIRVTDKNGVGVKTKGILVNSADSLIQYLDADANGILSTTFTPNDSLYYIRFGNQSQEIKPLSSNFAVSLIQNKNKILLRPSNVENAKSNIAVAVDGKKLTSYYQDTVGVIHIENYELGSGIHTLEVESIQGIKQHFLILVKSISDNKLAFGETEIKNNEYAEFSIDDQASQMSHMSVSIIDDKTPLSGMLDFYEEFFFDQTALDLQIVANRDFPAYLELFYAELSRIVNEDRLSIKPNNVLTFKNERPFEHISILDLTTLNAIDELNGDLRGIHNFEEQISTKSSVFPFHFTSYLQPIEMADFRESPNYKYPAIKTKLTIGEKERNLVHAYNLQKNIRLSFTKSEKIDPRLSSPDYTYHLENYELPNTMEELINYIVKFVSVNKDKSAPKLVMYRYNSSYKYSNSPLIFLNNLPVYDARTILNLSPKDLAKIEVRNSNRANEMFGNFGLNGSISFYLKDGVINPLTAAYVDLPVLEPYQDFNGRLVNDEYAPDFRHQLYWNSTVKKIKNAFWIELRTSDLNTNYNVQLTAFMKDGSVMQTQSKIAVQ